MSSTAACSCKTCSCRAAGGGTDDSDAESDVDAQVDLQCWVRKILRGGARFELLGRQFVLLPTGVFVECATCYATRMGKAKTTDKLFGLA